MYFSAYNSVEHLFSLVPSRIIIITCDKCVYLNRPFSSSNEMNAFPQKNNMETHTYYGVVLADKGNYVIQLDTTIKQY